MVVQSARATYSAHGATRLPQVGAVSESLEQRLLESLQFPFGVSMKSERLNGSCINQSSIHAQASSSGGETVPIHTIFPNVALDNISIDKSELLVGSFTGEEEEQTLWALPFWAGRPAA